MCQAVLIQKWNANFLPVLQKFKFKTKISLPSKRRKSPHQRERKGGRGIPRKIGILGQCLVHKHDNMTRSEHCIFLTYTIWPSSSCLEISSIQQIIQPSCAPNVKMASFLLFLKRISLYFRITTCLEMAHLEWGLFSSQMGWVSIRLTLCKPHHSHTTRTLSPWWLKTRSLGIMT